MVWRQSLPRWLRVVFVLFGMANMVGGLSGPPVARLPGLVIGFITALIGWKGGPPVFSLAPHRLPTFRIVLWMVCAVAIVFGYGSIRWLTFSRLAAHGVRTQGMVTGSDSKSGHFINYQYTVDGQTIHAQGLLGPPNSHVNLLQVDQPVTLTYNPLQPSESVPGDPYPALVNETLFIIAAAILGPTFVVTSMTRALHRQQV